MSFDNFFDEPKFDYESEKKKFIQNLNFLKSMSVQEITLYKKWEEFNKDSYSMLQKASKFDGDPGNLSLAKINVSTISLVIFFFPKIFNSLFK